ncbi:hypothetical protein JCM3774_002313 [Rhodotorula dairenensis]
MGVLPTPNHLALVRDCYPPHNSKATQQPQRGDQLPHAVSNAVSKLAFYAVNRPAKLPKVVAALTERAARARGSSAAGTAAAATTTTSAAVKDRVELGITCDILRTLVIECAESGNQGSAELVKSALAEPALSVADMALGGSGGPATARAASSSLPRPDAELEARGASLFHAVATMTTPPFFGFGLAARQYQRCLATLSARVQLTGPDHSGSRYVALKALEGAARSDVMFATGSDFDRQVGQLAPALFCTCLASSLTELEHKLLESRDSLAPLPPSLRSRKSAAISPPDSDSASKAVSPGAEVAVKSLAHLSRHSTVPQLLVIHSTFLSYLENHESAPLRRPVAQPRPAPAVAKTLLVAAPESHRNPALSWWADRAAESTEPERTVALLDILRHLVVGLAAKSSSEAVSETETGRHRVGALNASGILNTLAEMLILRSGLGAGANSDPVVEAVLSTLAALIETSDRIGYPSQLDDFASETISLVRALSVADRHHGDGVGVSVGVVEDPRTERLTAGMDVEAKARARRRLMQVLRMLVEPARSGAIANPADQTSTFDGDLAQRAVRSVEPLRSAAEGTKLPPSGGPDSPGQNLATRPPAPRLTSGSTSTTAIPGLALGAPIVVDGSTEPARREALAAGVAAGANGQGSVAQPMLLVHPPSNGHLDSMTTTTRSPSPTSLSPTTSDAVSLYTLSRSLFLLSDPDSHVRHEYLGGVLIPYLRQLVGRTEEANKAAETDAFWRRFAVEFYHAAVAIHNSITSSSSEPEAREEGMLDRLADAAFAIRSGSAVLACVPMLLSLLGGTVQDPAATLIARHARSVLAQTWGVPTAVAAISGEEGPEEKRFVEALASDAGVQSATRRERAKVVEALSTPWEYEKARQLASSSLSPYLSGALPARSLLQLGGLSRSRTGSSVRLSASLPQTPPSLARSSSGSGHGHVVTSLRSISLFQHGGQTGRRRLLERQQTPSLADLQLAAGARGTGSPGSDSTTPSQRGSASETPAAAAVRQGSLAASSSPITGVGAVSSSSRRVSTSSRTESVESLLERSLSSSSGTRTVLTRAHLAHRAPVSASMGQVRMSSGMGESTVRPESDKVMQDIADYVHNYEIKSDVAYNTARLCLIDTIGCGLEGLRVSEECRALMDPIVPGTVVPNGTKVPGTPFQMDPVRGAFAIGTQIRWLDFNECLFVSFSPSRSGWARHVTERPALTSSAHARAHTGWLAAEWGHPSDNLGAILAVADYLSRSGEKLVVKDVLTAMIKAHEIQGCIALENSFNRVGLDHVILVKLASAAVVSEMLGLTRDQTVDVISQVFVDGQSLRTFRHAPNTGSRKSWSAGDACMRAVHLAYQVKRGQMGIPTVLTAKTWGFYDVLFKGNEFKFQRPYGSYIMENVLFKISFPAEFHAQTAAEAAHILHKQLKDMGKSSDDIKHVKIRTQEAAIRIIDKSGPLHNFADRDHTIQYMVAVPLIFGRLTTEDYSDEVAADPRIDELRAKMQCVEDKTFTADYHDPEKRFISNALTVTLNDGTVLPEVHIDYPVGHKRRREEGTPLLEAKFERHVKPHFDAQHVEKILKLVANQPELEKMPVKDFTDLFVTKA